MAGEALTVRETLRRTVEHLAARGVENPRLDAELLLGKALGLERIEVYMEFDRPLTAEELACARALVARRAAREPLQYVIGEWGFRRLRLKVDARALIPRPETEIVVERCLGLLGGHEAPRILDVGVGGGAIALSLAHEHPGARVTAIDVSPDALSLAGENAAALGLEVELLHGDFRVGLPAGPWHLVVSNPPYVPAADRDGLEPEVRDHEPSLALYGDDAHTVIATAALPLLEAGGALVLEVGDGQAESVAARLAQIGYLAVEVTQDLSGRDRVVEGRRGD